MFSSSTVTRKKQVKVRSGVGLFVCQRARAISKISRAISKISRAISKISRATSKISTAIPKISTATFNIYRATSKISKLSSQTFKNLSKTILSHLQKTYSYFQISSKNIQIYCQMAVFLKCVETPTEIQPLTSIIFFWHTATILKVVLTWARWLYRKTARAVHCQRAGIGSILLHILHRAGLEVPSKGMGISFIC